MNFLKQVAGADLRRYTMVGALIVILLIFQFTTGGRMVSSQNIQNLLISNTYVLVLALGMLMVIVVGHIDLSVGSVAAVCGMCAAMTWNKYGWPWWLSIILGLLIGAVIGCWQGFFLSKLGIPGFITTLAGWMMFRGVVVMISHSVTQSAPPQLRKVGSGYLPDWRIGASGDSNGFNVPTVIIGVLVILLIAWSQLRAHHKRVEVLGEMSTTPCLVRIAVLAVVVGGFTYLMAAGNPGTSLPIPTIIVGLLVVFYSTLTQRTAYGRHVYAIGGNRAAAALSGISVPKTYFLTMMNMSILAAVAGLLFVGRATAAGPNDGNMWELDAIASVFIGGAAVTGGIGTVGGTMVGALVMASINSGMMLLGWRTDQTQIVKGLVLLAAVALDVFNKRQGRASIIGQLTKSKTTNPPPSQPAAVARPTK
ncbi:MAG: sugar ABC transporter permease [Bifidobacteriaceae bacterium]|jgi:putative multiple sugar transport system permease protein|nr:sugar ABC transporter permease [Bifidobacteriaceae bacterium]